MKIEEQKVLVVGTGISGIAAAELLQSKNVDTVLFDGNKELDLNKFYEKAPKLKDMPIILGELTEEQMHEFGVAVLSPGVPTDLPMVERLRAQNVAIWGEIELAYYFGKGRLIAIQLKALLEGGENSLYYELSRHENELAIKLAKGVTAKGYQLWIPHQTNQVFVIVDNDKIKELEKDFFFYTWCPYDETRSVIRLVISWGSTEEDVDAILAAL